MRRRDPGEWPLMGATVAALTLLVFIPVLVQWGQERSGGPGREREGRAAFNLAEAAVERARWKLEGSTAAWQAAVDGALLSGYAGDVAYNDSEGGVYRIRVSSGPGPGRVTVIAEGREAYLGLIRALRVVFVRKVDEIAYVAGGALAPRDLLEVHWGPVYSQGDIRLGGTSSDRFFPRKFARGVVIPRDGNGLLSPNTDNLEWWSGYPVPDAPLLDFAGMRAKAASAGTLNYTTGEGKSGGDRKCVGWRGHARCPAGGPRQSSHNGLGHFYDSDHHPESKNRRTYYWDGDLTLTGSVGHGMGLRGAVIVRGDLILDSPGGMRFENAVPPEAWKEYQKIDTAGPGDYPADAGYHTNHSVYHHGGPGSGWSGGPPPSETAIGIRGFLYVGGDVVVRQKSNIAGAVWVEGQVIAANEEDRVLVFYSPDDIQLDVLNVSLSRESLEEIPPSPNPW